MNRIVLIGNGFDLAHNIPTKYKDFINWYWEQRFIGFQSNPQNIDSDILCTFKMKSSDMAWSNLNYHYSLPLTNLNGIEKLKRLQEKSEYYQISKTPFFDRICKHIETKGWVDIENEYYNFLIEIYNHETFNYSAEKLNNELNFIRQKLSEYLMIIQNEQINSSSINDNIRKLIFSPIKINDIAIESRTQMIKFVQSRYSGDENGLWDISIEELLKEDKQLENINKLKNFSEKWGEQIEYQGIESVIDKTEFPDVLLYPQRIMLLNFNYTKMADIYMTKAKDYPYFFIINHIHGNLTENDSIIFGYGDELDNKYKHLKELNDNEYLRFFKSTRYLESDNYRKMLSFIESAPFQVLIMGHSCGNSDRTLLNTLFEHDNCVSIKPYFHQKDDGTDDYLDKIQNISRNFTNMKKMRDRVVNKTYCEPLPQAPKNLSN